MTDPNVKEKNMAISRSIKKKSWILIAVAFVLTVLSIVALAVGMQYLPQVFREVIDDKGVMHKEWVGPLYKELDSILAVTIAAVIGNFLLFVYFQIPHIRTDSTAVKSFVFKTVEVVLHILGAALVIGTAVITAAVFLSVSGSVLTTDAWILGAYGMCSIGETITFLIYYWNTRLLRGPAGADLDYVYDHGVIFKRSTRASAFTKFYIAVPYVALAVGYFVSVLFGFLAGKLGKFMCGGVHLVIIGLAVGLSIYFFFKKHRLSKRELANYRKRKNMHGSEGEHGGGSFVTDTDEDISESESTTPSKNITKGTVDNAIVHIGTPSSGLYASIIWKNRPYITAFDVKHTSVSVKGDFKCCRRSGTFRSGSDDTDEFNFEQDIERMCIESADRICDAVIGAVDDSGWNVRVTVSGHDDKGSSYTYIKEA